MWYNEKNDEQLILGVYTLWLSKKNIILAW